MLQDIRALHAEVVAFRQRLKELAGVQQVQNISAVARRIERESQLLESAKRDDHVFASTNTPDLVRMWRLSRSLPGLYAFNTTFQSFSRRKTDAVMIDVVYRKGHAWIVRSSLRYRALLSEIINLPMTQPLAGMAMDEDGPEPALTKQESFISLDSGYSEEEDLFCDTNMAQLRVIDGARKLIEAAGNNLKLGAMPSVSIYFPRLLEECRNEDDRSNVLKLFDFLRRMNVEPVTEIGPALSFEHNIGLQMKDDFGNDALILADQAPVMLDLTTLFVLCSDISNVNQAELRHSHKALDFQMQEEATVPCLRDRIFPIISGGRPLVCTPMAQGRFFEIVMELGSAYERERARLLFSRQPAPQSCHELSAISIHSWPGDLNLPILAQRFDIDTHSPQIPFTTQFKTSIAQDCFESCWYGRLLTLTANQQACKIFREALFSWPSEIEPRPAVHLHAARSLTMYHRLATRAADE